jgi:hypothetical protein
MASFYCLPQEIIINILKDVPIYAFRKCRDRKGNYFPIIDQFIKDKYISEEELFKSKNFLQLDYLLRKTIYKLSIEDMIKKLTLSYTQDYMKYVDDYGGIISYSKYIKGTPVSLIIFRIKRIIWGRSDKLIIGKYTLFYDEEYYTDYNVGLSHSHAQFPYHLDYIWKRLSGMLEETILASSMYKKQEVHYESIEIVKMFYPHGFVIEKTFDTDSPHEETVLMKYL